MARILFLHGRGARLEDRETGRVVGSTAPLGKKTSTRE
jgi:hypothetical protein